MYFQFLLNGVNVSPESLPLTRPTGMADIALRAATGAALRRGYADLPLSKRGGGEYLALRRQRREDLEALMRTGLDERSRAKALDLICAICEESWWAETAAAPFDDDGHPRIDLLAAETACLMAWTLAEGKFVPSVRARMLRELRRRVFTPLIAHDDYDCLQPEARRGLSILSLVIFASLMAEPDYTRRLALLRKLAPAADKLAELPIYQPLNDMLVDWACATAVCKTLRKMAGPQPLARQLPLAAWLDAALFAHLGEGIFFDPVGGGLADDINGADLYYLGKCGGDEAVEGLGAQLWQQRSSELTNLVARITTDYMMDMTANTAGAPRFRHAATGDMSIMSARGAGTFVALHTGGQGNAGAIAVYMDDMPVLYGCENGAITLDGKALTHHRGLGDCEFDDDRADMSVDITPACPKDGPVRFMQRTAMLDRESGMLRIIDMIEAVRSCEVAYVFTLAEAPELTGRGIKLGKALLTAEGGAEPEVARTEAGKYHLRFVYRLMPGSNMVNFVIDRSI